MFPLAIFEGQPWPQPFVPRHLRPGADTSPAHTPVGEALCLRWPFQIRPELDTPSSGKRRQLLYSPALAIFFYPPTGAFFKEPMETPFAVEAGRERRKTTNLTIMPATSRPLEMAPQLHNCNCTPISRFVCCD